MLSFVLAQILVQFQKPVIMTDVNNHKNRTTFIISEDGAVSFVPFQNHVWNDTFSLATMLVVMSFISILFAHHCFLGSNLLGVRLRIACSSLMYRKVLILSFQSTLYNLKHYFSCFYSECSIVRIGCKSNRHWPFSQFDVK